MSTYSFASACFTGLASRGKLLLLTIFQPWCHDPKPRPKVMSAHRYLQIKFSGRLIYPFSKNSCKKAGLDQGF